MHTRSLQTHLAVGLVILIALPTYVTAAKLDPSDPADAIQINRKIMCSTQDSEPVTYWWHGNAYSRRQGERDKLLFKVEGMNIRQCTGVNDPEKGTGLKLVSREILLYKDPKTGEVLAKWKNPWTGETVDVMHVANDPVNFSMHEVGRSGERSGWTGNMANNDWWTTTTVPLFYPNPLASEYQAEIGGTYHATEMFNFFGKLDDLLDGDKHTAEVQVGWSRMSDWLPWMQMGGREGVIYMHTAGHKLGAWDELSDTMKQEIREHYPDYVAPPPADDTRRNETSWLYYKKVRDGERQLPKRD